MRKLVIGTSAKGAALLFPLMVPKTESCNAFQGGAIARSRALPDCSSNTLASVARVARVSKAELRKMVRSNAIEHRAHGPGLHNAY